MGRRVGKGVTRVLGKRLLRLSRFGAWDVSSILYHLSFIILPLILLWRPLFDGEALFWGTPLLQFVPWQRLAAEMWRAGELPLWNSLLGCGAPLAANYQTGVFYPLYALSLFLPAETALGWTVALHLALTGLGMYAWGRAAGLDRFPAALAALALEGGGFVIARAGLFPSMVVTFPWLPIWLWRAERWVRTRQLRDVLWLGGALGLGLLAGHAQTAFYGGLLLLAYLAFRMFQRAGSEGREPESKAQGARGEKRGLVFGILDLGFSSFVIFSFLIGLALAAVQLFPTAELLSLSQRSAGVDREMGLTYSFWPWRLLTLVAPNLFGNPAAGNYWGYGNYWEDAVYIGLLPLLLALEAVVGLRRKGNWRRATVFWLLVAALSLLLALGSNTPIFPWLFDHVMTFDWFQSPSRWLALTTVALAALAGIGAQGWKRGRADRRRSVLGLVLGLAIALGGWVAPRLVPGLQATFGPATVRLGLTLALAGGLVMWRRKGDGWRSVVVGFVLLDLLAFGWGLAPSVGRALYRGQSDTGAALATDPAVERVFWPAGDRPEAGYDLKFQRAFRFDTFGPRDLDFWWPLREALLPNVGMLDGIGSANNFEPLRVGRIVDITEAADQTPALWRVMGVTHLVTATVDGQVQVTPLPDALGRAWVVPAAHQVPSDEMLDVLASPTFDPAAEVLLETVPNSNLQPAISNLQSLEVSDAPNRITITVVLDRPGFLVLADTWYPGWEVTVNGRAAALLRANTAFRAVALEAGEQMVEMVYRPLSVRIGGWVSLLSLAGWAVGMLLARKREGRA